MTLSTRQSRLLEELESLKSKVKELEKKLATFQNYVKLNSDKRKEIGESEMTNARLEAKVKELQATLDEVNIWYKQEILNHTIRMDQILAKHKGKKK
jgi:predicted RNase H-like nuclease (RuvC/YqgF family)